MILGPREGRDITFPGPPLLSREKNRAKSLFFSGNEPSAWWSSQAETQDMGQGGLCTLGPTHTHRHPHCGHDISWWLKFRQCWAKFLVWFWFGKQLSKGRSFLDFSLDVFGRVRSPKDTGEQHELGGALRKDPEPSLQLEIF